MKVQDFLKTHVNLEELHRVHSSLPTHIVRLEGMMAAAPDAYREIFASIRALVLYQGAIVEKLLHEANASGNPVKNPKPKGPTPRTSHARKRRV